MSELEDRLNAVMADEEQMSRLARMASRLMGSISPPEGQPSGEGEEALMGAVGRILGGMKGDGKKKQLLQGLAPYLAEERRRRLEKALRFASAARLAGAALAEMGERDESV